MTKFIILQGPRQKHFRFPLSRFIYIDALVELVRRLCSSCSRSPEEIAALASSLNSTLVFDICGLVAMVSLVESSSVHPKEPSDMLTDLVTEFLQCVKGMEPVYGIRSLLNLSCCLSG